MIIKIVNEKPLRFKSFRWSHYDFFPGGWSFVLEDVNWEFMRLQYRGFLMSELDESGLFSQLCSFSSGSLFVCNVYYSSSN